jgi:hypothetical protein
MGTMGMTGLVFDDNAGTEHLMPCTGNDMLLTDLPRGFDMLVNPNITIMATNIEVMYQADRTDKLLKKTVMVLLRIYLAPRREKAYYKRITT